METGWVTFFIVFAVSFAVQTIIWQTDTMTDEHLWEKRLVHLEENLANSSAVWQMSDFSGHPGMAPLMLAVVVKIVSGSSAAVSLKVAIAAMVGIMSSSIAQTARRINPMPFWWLTAAGTVIFHPLYTAAAPTNALTSPLYVLIIFLALLISRQETEKSRYLFFLGLALGVGLATRFTETALLSVLTLAFICWQVGWRPAAKTATLAAGTATALNPLFWHIPREYFIYIFSRVQAHALNIETQPLTILSFVLFSPLSLLSVVMAIAVWGTRKKISPPASNAFMGYLVTVTTVMSAVFLSSASQSLRYFMPLLFTWESLLPLWLLALINRRKTLPLLNTQLPSRTILTVAGILLVGGQAFLLFYNLYLNKILHVS